MSDLFYGGMQTVEHPGAGPGSSNDATARNVLGTICRHNGAFWRYVKFNNGGRDVASAAGGVAHWYALTMPTATVDGVFTVTSDYGSSLGLMNTVAGIFGGVVTDGYYTFVQISGLVTAKTDTGTIAGDKLMGGATDLTFTHIDDTVSPTDVVFGVALDTRNGTNGTNTVLLQNLLW